MGNVTSTEPWPSRAAVATSVVLGASLALVLARVVRESPARRQATSREIKNLAVVTRPTCTTNFVALMNEGEALNVLFFLAPLETVRLRATSSDNALARAAGLNVVWCEYSSRAFGLTSRAACQDPDGEDCDGDWKTAFVRWNAAASELGLPSVKSASALLPFDGDWIRLMRQLLRWLREHVPDAVPTLRQTRDRKSAELLREEGFEPGDLSPELLGLLDTIDGQNTPLVDATLAREIGLKGLNPGRGDRWSLGIFGGYAVYDHVVSMHLLPLASAAKLTHVLRRMLPPLQSESVKIAFALSPTLSKIYFVDRANAVWIWTRRPGQLLELASAKLGLRAWFAEYLTRLEAGVYKAMPIRHEEGAELSRGISLFPMAGPTLSRCVTCGVEVTASCVYMPEHPQGWTYSITLQLLGTEQDRGFATCQLDTRRWQIQEDGQEAEHIEGKGVIGFFPILAAGGWIANEESDPNQQYAKWGFKPGPFRYQSCSGRMPSMRGTFEGELVMVPGTLRNPTGDRFTVQLDAFTLCVPDVFF